MNDCKANTNKRFQRVTLSSEKVASLLFFIPGGFFLIGDAFLELEIPADQALVTI